MDGWVLRRLWKKWILKGSVRVCGDRLPCSSSPITQVTRLGIPIQAKEPEDNIPLWNNFILPLHFLVESQIIAEKHKQSLESKILPLSVLPHWFLLYLKNLGSIRASQTQKTKKYPDFNWERSLVTEENTDFQINLSAWNVNTLLFQTQKWGIMFKPLPLTNL